MGDVTGCTEPWFLSGSRLRRGEGSTGVGQSLSGLQLFALGGFARSGGVSIYITGFIATFCPQRLRRILRAYCARDPRVPILAPSGLGSLGPSHCWGKRHIRGEEEGRGRK